MKNKKKIIIVSVSIIIVAALAVALVAFLKKNNSDKKSADVYPMSQIAYPADQADYNSQMCLEGNVIADKEQRVYLEGDDRIKNVNVSEGDVVKAGDLLVEYDMTEQKLKLETKKAEVEIAHTNVLKAERQLKELQSITPVEPKPEEPEIPNVPDASATDAPVTDIPGTDETDTVTPETEEAEVTYTKEELDKAISDKTNEIRDLKIAYQMQQIELEIMQYNIDNGGVTAEFDGTVIAVNDPEEAIINNEPIVVLSGSGGYTVRAYIGELSLENVKVGDTVSMYCYDTGMGYDGEISEISDIPSSDFYGYSEVQQSYYPITITVNDAEGLMRGMYLEVYTENTSSDIDENALCIPMVFVKKENGTSYVMKEENGRLKKVYIKTGKVIWGDSIIVKSGVTYDDYLAIPYSKDAEEGVKTIHKDVEDLYR